MDVSGIAKCVKVGRDREGGGGLGSCLFAIRACLDTTVPFRSPIQMPLFLPFQKGKERSFHSGNGRRTERSCFYQTNSKNG